MRIFLLFLILVFGGMCLAQTSPTSLKKLGNAGSETWAVVVGISDYQDGDIPDLRFAHKDAEAFALWLQSPAGGSLDGDQLQLLINEKATAGRVAEALDALLERVQENDKVFIYFSGHGDVERKTLSQPGFLLCWDAPSRVYMGGGTYSLAYLQEIVTSLTLQNMAKVTVIADACRAGKLAGSQVGGPQLTSANLQRQQANELKILSCQPEEYSLEGTQWGGGRGVFSYHLMDGLYGLADRNTDGVVTLGELDRYLEDHVTSQAAPISQVPVLLGNKTERVALIDEEALADLSRIKSGEKASFASTDSRGLEESILANLDSNIVEQYMAFKQAVMEKRFFPSSDNEKDLLSAEALYTRLIVEPGLSPLYGAMRRNYAAALQDEAQQTLNEWLKTNQEVSLEAQSSDRMPLKVFTEKVRSYPRCLERAAELLGEEHYMYPALKARQYFFEGYLLANSNRNPNQDLGEKALDLFRQSLAWQPEQPHVYWQISEVFGWNLTQPDSLEHYARRAVEVHPNWLTPCTNAAFWLSYRYRQQERARPFLEQASRIDSSSVQVWVGWASYYVMDNNLGEAERQLKNALLVDSTFVPALNNLGNLYLNTHRFLEAEQTLKRAFAIDSTEVAALNNLGSLYKKSLRYAEAEQVFKKALLIDSMVASVLNNLGQLYNDTRRYIEAEPILEKALSLDSTRAATWSNLGNVYTNTRRFAKAELASKKAIALDSTLGAAWSNLGIVYLYTRRYAEAEPVLKRALAIDSMEISVWNNLGGLYGQTRRFTEAEDAFKKVVAFDSTNIHAWNNLGMLYLDTGRYAEAEQVFKNNITRDSAFAILWNNLGWLYIKTQRYAEAIPVLEKAIWLDSTYALAMNSLFTAYSQSQRYTEAEQVLKKVLALDSTKVSTWNNLGNLYLKTHHYAEAEATLKKAISIDSTFANPRKHLGMVYFKTDRPKEARENFLKAIELDRNYAGAMHGMAYLLAAEGKTEEALGYVEQAIGKGSTFDELEIDENLAPLRALPEWQTFMKKYFSD